MTDQQYATPSQQAAVAEALRNSGGTFPASVTAPTITPHSEYQPRISASLMDVVTREIAADAKPNALATADALSKHVGISLKDATPAIEALLKDAGVTASVTDLSPTTIAALHAVAQSAARIAQHRGGQK